MVHEVYRECVEHFGIFPKGGRGRVISKVWETVKDFMEYLSLWFLSLWNTETVSQEETVKWWNKEREKRAGKKQ